MTNQLNLNLNRKNYSSIVLAGLGMVGRGILAVGKSFLKGFEEVVLLDNNPDCVAKMDGRNEYPLVTVDIENPDCLRKQLEQLRPPVLLINTCSGIDTVLLRRAIAAIPAGYIDICGSSISENPQAEITVSMPYTNQLCHGQYPHLICQGSNPGLVEYMVRLLIDRMGHNKDGYCVTIYENDQLKESHSQVKGLVSWSPRDLIDEIAKTPLIEYARGQLVEGPLAISERIMTQWQDGRYPMFKVGHEDIWNLSRLNEVSDAVFYYGFCEDVMNILQMDCRRVLDTLRLPAENEELTGLERVVISVEHSSGLNQTVLWELDHAQTQRDLGINAVQYQTANATLLSALLMQHTDVGLWKGTYNASTLPLAGADWNILTHLMNCLGIRWQFVPKEYVCRLQKSLSKESCI